MTETRFFIHASAATIEDMIDAAERHGTPVEARGYLSPLGRGIYGSVEIVPHVRENEAEES